MDNLLSSQVEPKSTSSKTKIALISMIGVVGVIAAIASFNYSSPKAALQQFILEDSEFQAFLSHHGKQYSGEEYSKRFEIFRDNLSFIRIHNAQAKDWILGVNQFADLSFTEFKARYTPLEFTDKKIKKISEIQVGVEGIPSSVDWRAKGAVSPVKNEGACFGGSYAFSGVGAIEGIWNITGNPLVVLSEQEILDCSGGSYGNAGCKFGIMDNVFEYVIAKGITSDSNYPFKASSGTCNGGDVTKIVAEISDYQDVQEKNSTALLIAASQQPVSVAVQADQTSWQFYKGGVVTNNCGNNPDHAVLIVGYSTVKNPNYWILKNSWGADWGEQGYIRIGIKGEDGLCGINLHPSYPVAQPQ